MGRNIYEKHRCFFLVPEAQGKQQTTSRGGLCKTTECIDLHAGFCGTHLEPHLEGGL